MSQAGSNQFELKTFSPIEKEFIDSIENVLERIWLRLYLSGNSIAKIARASQESKELVAESVKKNHAELMKRIEAQAESINEVTQSDRKNAGIITENETKVQEKSKTKKPASKKTELPSSRPLQPEKRQYYRPGNNKRALYKKLRTKIESQFDKKFFIGDIRITDEEYEELLEYTRFQLKSVTFSTPSQNNLLFLAVALVQIGIRCYNGNYWRNALVQELKVSNSPIYQRFLGDSFVATLEKHGKYVLDRNERVQCILFHSFVTDYYSKGLFELLFQYYSKDLERDINRNDRYQMQALMDTLVLRASQTEEESEAFTKQFMERGSRAYKLRQHTLQAISANRSHSSRRLRHILRLIDRAFWKDVLPKNPVSRISILFKEWRAESPAFNKEYRLYQTGVIRNRGKKHFSSPYLFADIKNTAFYLELPAQIVREADAQGLTWQIKTENSKHEVPVSTYPVLTGFKTEHSRIPVETKDLFSEISTVLCRDGNVVRQFAKIPADKLRLFDMEGDYSARLFRIPMCAYTPNDFILQSPALLDHIRQKGLVRWDFEFVNGDLLILQDGRSMVVGERYIDGLTPRGIVENVQFPDETDSAIPVYSRVPELVLTLQKTKIAGTVLDVNGIKNRLSDCKCIEFDKGDTYGQQAIYLQLNQFRGIKSLEKNQIWLDTPGNSFSKEFSFVYAPGLKAEFDGAPYVFEEIGTLVFPSQYRVDCTNRNVQKFSGENGFHFEIGENVSVIDVLLNEKLPLQIDVPALLWSTDETNWKTAPIGDIWHTDFKNIGQLYFKTPDSRLSLTIDDDAEDEHRVDADRRQDGISVLDLTRFRTWINRDKAYFDLGLRVGRKDYSFARVYVHGDVTACDLTADFEKQQMICTCDVTGESAIYVDIVHMQTGTRIKEKALLENGRIAFEDRLRNGNYLVIVYEAEEDDFFDEPTFYLIHSFTRQLVNKNDLSGMSLRVLSFRKKETSLVHTNISKRLRVLNIDKVAPHRYEGIIKDEDDQETRVAVEFEDEEQPRYFQLYFWDDYDEAFYDYMFDRYTAQLVKEEESGLRPSVRYRRYKMLYDTDYVFYGEAIMQQNV